MDKILEISNLTKTFNHGAVIANEDISISFERAKVHAIIGENGAGKTTLVSMLIGLKKPTSGNIFYNGKKINIANPSFANKLGIGFVPQHIDLIENKTVWENVILGNEMLKWRLIDEKASIARVDELITKYGFALKAKDKVSKLSLSQKQKVQILKTLFTNSEIIIFDEPTSVLSTTEIAELLHSINELKKSGKTIIFISHKLGEIKKITDDISVLRRGKLIKTLPNDKDATIALLTDLIIGSKNGEINFHNPYKPGNNVLVELKNLGTHSTNHVKLNNINLQIHEKEIIGVLGVDGNGQEELVKVILQRKKKINKESSILIDGKEQMGRKTNDILRDAVALLPEDRHTEGLVLAESIKNNFFLTRIDDFAKKGILDFKKQNSFVAELIKQYDIRGCSDVKQEVASLSGGNQQKIIFARELSKNNKLFIAHKPTTGVDIGAIKTIYSNLFEYVNSGNCAIVISDEVEEIIQISHRLIVFFAGEIMGVVPKNTPMSVIGRMMLGEKYEQIV